jgi:hypothetical protein
LKIIKGPVCWSKGCHGAYTYSCGGALCTQSSSDCAELLGGIGENVLFGVMDILTLVGSLGTNVAALASSYSDISAIGVALINDICANPNKLQTQCIRKIDNGKLQSCNSTGVNPVSCGLFCTSTKIVCAKTTIDLTSQIAGVLGLVGSAVPNKNAEKIASEISSKDLKKILDAIKLIDAATLDYQIFQTFVDLMSGSLGSGCWYFLFIFGLTRRCIYLPSKVLLMIRMKLRFRNLIYFYFVFSKIANKRF